MAVEAIGAVVIQRVTDLLIQRSTFFDKFIDQVEDIRLDLRRMRGLLIDAERRLSEDPEAKIWAEKYLKTLFSLEDEVEKYVLGLAKRRRNYIVLLERRTGFFLHDFLGSGRALRLRLESIKEEIGDLQRTKPDSMVDASLQGQCFSDDDIAEETETGPEGQRVDGGEEGEVKKDGNEGCASVVSSAFDWTSAGSSDGKSPHTFSYKKRDFDVVGFENDINRLAYRLKRNDAGDLIAVVGPSGSGKTTLVRSVYKRLDIKAHFGDNFGDCRVWVHLPSEEYTCIAGLWMVMVQQITKSKESNGSLDPDQLRTKLVAFLREEEEQKKRRYMIVLDSVQSLEVWENLSRGFPDLDNRKSKVILITRNKNLAKSIISHKPPHTVAELNEEDSWKLFLKKLCPDDQEILQDHPIFRSKILTKCKYRPFNIVLLGGLLSTKALGYDEWSWYLSQTNWQKMDILSLSYNDLQAHSKLCLLYMSLFPTEVDIPIRRLHRLWLAEGFVRKSPGMTEEESVEECFNDLVKRNLVKISKLKSDESTRNCRLPCAVRDFLLPKARDVSLFHIHREREGENAPSSSGDCIGLENGEHLPSYRNSGGSALTESSLPTFSTYESNTVLGVRRIVEYADIRKYNPNVFAYPNCSPFEDLRSYLSFNFQMNDTPATEVENFITKSIGIKGFGLLRVLDLEGVYKPALSETLKKLLHLRYLGLRWTFIDHLPDCVGDLPYLETLDLKRTYINNLPMSIRKLKHLRYLNLPDVSLENKQTRRQHPSSFTDLQALLGLAVDERTQVKDDLDQLLKLRELGLTCQLHSSQTSNNNLAPLPDLWGWIQKLKNLRSLWLRSKDETGRPSKIILEPLPDLDKLSLMNLMGNLEKLVSVDQFPPNLKVLCLSVSRLQDDPMPILSQLPHLSVLRLRADSYLGNRMMCPSNGFVSLRVLKIWMLKNLTEWEVEKGGFPCLNELNIRKCPALKQIPIQVLNQGTLEEMTLTGMPDNIIQEVIRNVERLGLNHMVIKVNDYEFTPLPWESETNSDLWPAI